MISSMTWFVISLVATGFTLVLVIVATVLFKKALDLNPLLAKKDQLIEQINAANVTLTGQREALRSLQSDLENAQRIIATKEDAEEFLKSYGLSVENAKQEIEKIKSQMRQISEQKETIDKEKQEAQAELNAIRNDCSNAQYQKERIEKETKDLTDSIASLKKEE